MTAQDTFNDSITPSCETGCGTLYVTISFTKDKQVKNVFSHLGKAGGCPSSFLDALSYATKLMVRGGIPKTKIIKCLKGITCPQSAETASSCSDALGKILEKYLEDAK